MNQIDSMERLVNEFSKLPSVGKKTAERYAFSILNMDKDKIDDSSESIKNIKKNITSCNLCGSMSDSNKCMICEDDNREPEILCVVENQKNVFIFEKLGVFKTKYHVLGGLISPMEGRNPEDLTINKLMKRIKDENIKELILALRPGIEGNTTALYIRKILEGMDVKVTQIAQGVPIGADMEYLDNLTLELALENRSEIA